MFRLALLVLIVMVALAELDAPSFGFSQVPGSPFGGTYIPAPALVAFSPNGKFLVDTISEYVGSNVLVFSVDPRTGTLTELPVSAIAGASDASLESVAFSPSGDWLAIARGLPPGGVAVFAFDETTGSLSQVSGSPFAVGTNGRDLAFSTDGRFLAVTTSGPDAVSMFSVNSETGALAPVAGSPFPAPGAPVTVSFSPDGRYLATASQIGVDVFSVDGAAGALSLVAGSPFTTDSGPYAATFSPDGRYLATADGEAISMFSVNEASGSLSSLPGSPYPERGPTSVAFNPRGDQLAGGNDVGGVSVFAVDGSTGALREVAGSPFPGGGTTAAFSPDGRLLAMGSHTVVVYSTAIDPPAISIRVPANGAVYPQRQAVTVRYNCREGAGGLGLASCIGHPASGAKLDTRQRGRHTITVIATSQDGKRTTRSVTYRVGPPSNRFTISRINSFTDGTIKFRMKVPGPGLIDVLETAWKSNLVRAAVLLQPAPKRFAFARKHARIARRGTAEVSVTPSAAGRLLVAHPRYRVTLRLWITYTPTDGRSRTIGLSGLQLPTRCVDPDHDGDCDGS